MTGHARGCGVLLTVFLAYHLTTVAISNVPESGPSARLRQIAGRYALMDLYRHVTGIHQRWFFFAPDPLMENPYVRVLVTDQNGGVTDLEHDSYGRQHYPYLWYDYMRKINRRLTEAATYHVGYAGWVCRTWERTHRGRPAREVRLVQLVTRIPSPRSAQAVPAYDPRTLPVEEHELGRFACAQIAHGQLPPDLRERFGLPPAPADTFKRAPLWTWWDRREGRAPHDERRSDAPDRGQ